jgi:hypothetical protein
MTEIADSLLQKIADRLENIEADLKLVRAKTDRIDGIETEVAVLGARTDRMEHDLTAVRVKIDGQPDMRLLFQNVKLTLQRIVMIERDLVMLRSAMNDFGRESVTPGEIQAIHQALDTLREADLDQEARLRVPEAHLPT